MPWNAALWYMGRRLRLAIEVDCDHRVMRHGDLDLRSYAELLITIGARRAVPGVGVGFSVGRPFLEHRIERMTALAGRTPLRTACALVGVACALTVAWSVPQPVRAADIGNDVITYCPDGGSDLNRSLLDFADRST
jgi:beta-lactamase regulating signal transducer with metallopeptidase domain